MAFVKAVASDAQFAEIISTTEASKLIVVDFTASWCGPCKAIKPFFAELASKFRNVLFLSVDIDQLKGTAQAHGVQAVPTFDFMKGGQVIATLKGADPRQLQAHVEQHQGPQESGSGLGSGGAHAPLTEFIDQRQIECLNQSDSHGVANIFGKDAKSYLESDVDEQLIIVVPFNQVVKLHSFKITGPKENAPETIKTFINRPTTLSFDEADSIEPIEVLDLSSAYIPDPTDANLVSATVNLRFVKYQSVNSVTFFIGQNLNKGDVTVVNKLVLFGSPVEVTKNLAELKKDHGHDH